MEKSNWIEIIGITIKHSSNYLPLKNATVTFKYGPQRSGIRSEFCQMRHFGGITIPKSEIFFMNCILPELVGKFYARAQQNENVSTVANDHTSPCFVIVNSQTLAP